MRISDWSSDVCSSDLAVAEMRDAMRVDAHRLRSAHRCDRVDMAAPQGAGTTPNGDHPVAEGIGTHAGNPVEIFAAEGAFGGAVMGRSEERRVGKEWVSTCRSRWSPYH